MTAEDRAKDLVSDFHSEIATYTSPITYEIAKRCAAKCVQMIMDKHKDDWDSESEYWNEVKQEIENL